MKKIRSESYRSVRSNAYDNSGGGSNPFLPMEKCEFSHFFPWGKMGKKYMEREGNEYFSLSFHILFFPIFPHGEKWESTHFSMGKIGVGPPPPILRQHTSSVNSFCSSALIRNVIVLSFLSTCNIFYHVCFVTQFLQILLSYQRSQKHQKKLRKQLVSNNCTFHSTEKYIPVYHSDVTD